MKNLVLHQPRVKSTVKTKPKLRDMLPDEAIIHPSKGMFSPTGAFENVFMESPWKQVCIMAFDHNGDLWVAQSAGMCDFDYVVSKVDLETGVKTAHMIGDDMQNLLRRTVYQLSQWRVVTTCQMQVSLPEIDIQEVTVDWDDNDLLM